MDPLTIPELETERTLMRGWRESDAEPVAAWSADPDVARFVGGVQDATESWRKLAGYIGHWQLRGYGPWAVERKEDHMLLGRVGLWYPAGWPGIEVGWTLRRDAWGQGYAQETAQAAIQWTWDNLNGLNELISVIHPENAASIKVAQRLGMRFSHDHLLRGETPTKIYALSRPAASG